jgi:hypothetical protein
VYLLAKIFELIKMHGKTAIKKRGLLFERLKVSGGRGRTCPTQD